jgi:thymidylate kinase
VTDARQDNTIGVVITVAGPDGAGKTSLCDALVARVLNDRAVRRVHHRVGLLPVRARNVDPTRPHAQVPYPPGVSQAKVLVLFAESLLASFLVLRPFVKRGGIVLVERGWWDLAVDPLRYRLRPHPWLVRALGLLLPRSDLLIVLEGSSELLASRKDECSDDELARQTEAWRSVVASRIPRVYLDVALPFEEVVRRAAFEIERLIPSRSLRAM